MLRQLVRTIQMCYLYLCLSDIFSRVLILAILVNESKIAKNCLYPQKKPPSLFMYMQN